MRSRRHRTVLAGIAAAVCAVSANFNAAQAVNYDHPYQQRQLVFCKAYRAAEARGDKAEMARLLALYRDATEMVQKLHKPSACVIP